jgi:hypothetical protein
LIELAIAAGLGTFCSEECSRVVNLHRKLTAVQVMFNDSSHDTCCPLGTQGDGTAPAIFKGIHLFANYIGRLANSAREELRILKDGKFNELISGDLSRVDECAAHVIKVARAVRDILTDSLRRLKLCH